MMIPAFRKLVGLGVLVFLGGLAITAAGAPKKQPPAHPIDLNHATAAELQQVPGIGPVTARAILQFREKSGPFRSVDELRSIPGIGPKRLAHMRPYLTVAPARPGERQMPKSPRPGANVGRRGPDVEAPQHTRRPLQVSDQSGWWVSFPCETLSGT